MRLGRSRRGDDGALDTLGAAGGQPTRRSGCRDGPRGALLRARSGACRPRPSIPAAFARIVEFLGARRRTGARRHYREVRRGRRHACSASTTSSPSDREIEIAPGVFFPAWTYNGQVPGPTHPRDGGRSRPRELPQPGHRTRTRFTSTAGIRPRWTARCPSTRSCRAPRSSTSSTPSRSGLHLYHCHAVAAEAAHPQGPLRRVHRRSHGRRARRPTSS